MKQLLLLVALAACCHASYAAPAQRVKPATFTTPYAHPADPTYPIGSGYTGFRWGWFGADHYPPAPVMNRDYTRGWREWHYRR